ncbi:MAG: NAD(P)-binding protein [Verrucomicrobiae bacterium]|nr:NAD(P)-binding protein [Verrucomicrobiae bacterium]MDW8307763.1 UDP-galactopyranose mutase [Verrucomicrobiales bacterium]
MASRPFAVAGAGFAGAVVARELAVHTDRRVIVFDERPHVAGNCHTERDEATGVMVHRYGSHIFHTDRQDVWEYVNRFMPFRPYIHRVMANTPRGMFSLPINLLTINQFFGKTFSPEEARAFLESLAEKRNGEPANFEEQALRMVGRELYENFFEGYTRKHWGCDPREIPASVLKRLPVRFNYNDCYYDCVFQGIPEGGYTELVRRILEHPRIEVRLAQKFDPAWCGEFEHVFYTGPIDAFFGFRHGRLAYRTVTFQRHEARGDFQGTAVINYTDVRVPYTRVHEYKHFTRWEQHERTVAFFEFSQDTGPTDIPYYPVRRPDDKARLRHYYADAVQTRGVSFLGRLATYRYLDMHQVIAESLDFAATFLAAWHDGTQSLPTFTPTVAGLIARQQV